MSYRDADMYGDVIDVLDNVVENVESYLAFMRTEEEESGQTSEDGNSVTSHRQEHAASLLAALLGSPCRASIKECGPQVLRLSESVQSVLRDVVDRQQSGLTSPMQSSTSKGPTAEATRKDAARALITRKLGEVMESAHTMRSVVKQQQQPRARRFGQQSPPPRTTADDGASGIDLRMRTLLRVVASDLEDTERLLRFAFPEGVATSTSFFSSPPPEERDVRLPTFSSSGASCSPERPSATAKDAYATSETPRHSSSTVPYVRRSESMDTSGLPRQPSPSATGNANSCDVSGVARVVGLSGGAEDDSVLCSPDASASSVLSNSQHSGTSSSPRERLALDRNDAEAAHDSGKGARSPEQRNQVRASGLTSNRVHLRQGSGSGNDSNENSTSSHRSSRMSSAGGGDTPSAIHKAAASVGRSFSNVLGGVMQLAPFSPRQPSLMPYEENSCTTTTGDAEDEGEDTAARRDIVADSGVASSSSTTSVASLRVATETKAYGDPLQIIAASHVPRGILKTSSSRLGGSAAMVAEAEGDSNSSTSRPTAISSPGTSRPGVQFAEDVLRNTSSEMQHATGDGGSAGNSNSATTEDALYRGGGDAGCESSITTNLTMNNSSSSIGSGRLRGLPAGLPPRSPRQRETLPSSSMGPLGSQRPPLAPTPSASTSLTSFPAPTRNVWVSTTHSQRLPGELWGDILASSRKTMENVLREDVVDLFNYGEPEPILHMGDVTEIRFNFIDTYLYMRFELEHQRSLTESEVNLRLGLCSYPLMTSLYEDYFQVYQAQEFEPIEDSLTTLSNATTSMNGSVRLSISGISPSSRDEHRLANTISLSLATPQAKSPTAHDGHVPIISPLSIATDLSNSHTVSLVDESTVSLPFTPHKPNGPVALPSSTAAGGAARTPETTSVPNIGTPPALPRTASAAARAPASKAQKTKPTVSAKSSSLIPAAPSVNDANSHHPMTSPPAPSFMTSGATTPSNMNTPISAVPWRNTRRTNNYNYYTKDDSLLAGATTASSLGSSMASFAVAARHRESPLTSPTPSSSSASTPSSTTARSHAHTVRLSGQHWEAVTLRVPEDDLADAFISDVGVALCVLPSEARASCQHPRFYLGSLVVKFRWNNAELYPGASPLTAAEVDEKLADSAFPSMRKLYATMCEALHLVNDMSRQATREAEESLSSMPEAKLTLPKKAELDHLFVEEAPVRESSATRESLGMQHRGEGAPSRSPSISLHALPALTAGNIDRGRRTDATVQPRRTTPARTPRGGTTVKEAARAPDAAAAHTQRSPSPREYSPDPIAATHLTCGDANASAEHEPRVKTPLPSQPTVQSRSRSSQRHSHSPMAPPRGARDDAQHRSDDTVAAESSAIAQSRHGGRRRESPRRQATPPRRTESATEAPPPSTTLVRLARQHGVTVAALLQWNPALAQTDVHKLIPVPESLVVPRAATRPPSSPVRGAPPAAAAATAQAPLAAAQQTPRDAQPPFPETASEEETVTTHPSAVPRSISARRYSDGGVVASLRYRPRLTPKEASATVPPPPPPTLSLPSPPPSDQQSKRSASSGSSRTLPPPLSVADVATRRTAQTTSSALAAAPVAAVAPASVKPRPAAKASDVHAAVASPNLSGGKSSNNHSSADKCDSLEHSAHSQRSAPPSHAGATKSPHAEVPTSHTKPNSVPRLREASPRTAQAAAAATAATTVAAAAPPPPPPDHRVYHLPPEVLGIDPILHQPAAKTHAASGEHPSASRSARRQHPRPLPDATGDRKSNSGHAIASATGSDAGDTESTLAAVVEQEMGFRVRSLTVEGVKRKGAAAEAGLQVGDTLRTMDGQILASDKDLYRGLLHNAGNEQTIFVTAVTARGNPVTYRLRVPATSSVEATSGRRFVYTTARKSSAASTTATSSTSGTPIPQSLQPPSQRTAAAAATARHTALLPPPSRQLAPAQSARAASGGPARQQANTTALAAASTTTTTSAVQRGATANATPAARMRVSSIGAAARETRAQRSHSSRVLRETAAPATVHTSTAASVAAPLSARRMERDNLSAPRARANPKL